jgi:folylpolyglutamate synthase/dihydropteroate synthase
VHDTDAQAPGASPGGSLTFYLDGAHTPESMEVCAKWFCEALQGGTEPTDELASGRPANGSSLIGSSENGAKEKETAEKNGKQNGGNAQLCGGAHGELAVKKEGGGLEGTVSDVRRVLLFNCMQEREPIKLLDPLCRIAHSEGELHLPGLSSAR